MDMSTVARLIGEPARAAMLDALLSGRALPAGERARRRFARPCLDLTERRPHLAGALAAAVCARTLELGWLVRRPADGRALRLTGAGREGLAGALGVTLPGGP